ncbi:DUF6372 family protein [Kribbella sp. NPDC056861]
MAVFYHHGKSTCLEAAETGRILRAVTLADPLTLCAACYAAIAPLADLRS